MQTHSAFDDLTWPAATDGFRVPYGVFLNPALHDLEQERVFRGPTWNFVGLAAEVPAPGDFKSTFIGATPVILTRDADGGLNVLVNRCAHRGALVCREPRGNSRFLNCVYHQWGYDLKGCLKSVPMKNGVRGVGGMPPGFDMDQHGLQRLRVESIGGLVFASFSGSVAPLREYLGPTVAGAIERIAKADFEVLGDQRQYMHGNWKLYAENTRDPYHASLLHLFHTTFGLYRSTQQGACVMDDAHRHCLLYAKAATSDAATDREVYQDVRSFNGNFNLQDPSLLAGRPDFDDGITLVILSVFPNLVLQQIANTLAVRQINPTAVDAFELVWTQFGYVDDPSDLRAMRLKQGNLIGPAGLISMEDGEAVEIVQKGVARDAGESSYLGMGGGRAEDAQHLVTESSIVGFWEHYRRLMD